MISSLNEQMQTPVAKPKRQQYYAVDIAKFICAILVVAGHTFPLGTYSEAGDFLIIQGIARVVVPFFFLTAAYLFFSHYQPPLPKSWREAGYLWHYIERLSILFFFWSIICYSLIALAYLMNGVENGSLQFMRSFFAIAVYPCIIVDYAKYSVISWWQSGMTGPQLSNFIYNIVYTFNQFHLWYFPSLMLGMAIIYALLRRLRIGWVIAISAVLFLLGTPVDAYYGMTIYVPPVRVWVNQYISMFYTTRNGVFYATLFISIGALLAWKNIRIRKEISRLIFMISFSLMIVESQVLRYYQIQRDYNFYFFAIPAAIFLLLWLKEVNLKEKPIYRWLREASVLIYCSHGVFIFIVPALFGMLGLTGFYTNSLIRFASIYLLSVGFSALVLWLEKKPNLQFLRNLH